MFETYGYRVLVAFSGLDALKLFDTHGVDVDLVLSDLDMPSLNGVSFLDCIKVMDDQVKCIVSSGLSSQDDLLLKFQKTFKTIPLVRKPFQLGEILKIIRYQLEGVKSV